MVLFDVFVYGTFKRGLWNHKYLDSCKFIGTGNTKERYPLVVDESAIPFVLDVNGTGHVSDPTTSNEKQL